MNKLIEEITKRNELRYGKIQKCCDLFLDSCRCKDVQTKVKVKSK